MKAVVVTNIPAPYRVPVFNKIKSFDFVAVFCAKLEPNRLWDVKGIAFNHIFLRECYFESRPGNFVHSNFDIFSALKRERPDCVITTGFNPTHLFAFFWCILNGVPHISMTDGSYQSESSLGFLHYLIRRLVFKFSSAYIAASDGGFFLYKNYGVDESKIFKSPLAVDNKKFMQFSSEKKYDVIFSGQIIERKMPFFFLDVCSMINRTLPIKICVMGDGPLRLDMEKASIERGLNVEFVGFKSQSDLPEFYAASRVLLFPTKHDPWGVVANEAMAAGVPVIISSVAGAANEIVINGENGFVCDNDVDEWSEKAIRLLLNDELYCAFSDCAKKKILSYSFEAAASGIESAVKFSINNYVKGAGFKRQDIKRKSLHQRKILVVQRRMTHYRVPFFNRLRHELSLLGIGLDVLYGEPTRIEMLKNDSAELSWGRKIKTHYFLNGKVCVLPYISQSAGYDLVVLTHENKLVLNVIGQVFVLSRRFALWGHGKDLQGGGFFRNCLKRFTLKWADWWFAYTDLSADIVADAGYPKNRISIINNAIDTSGFAKTFKEISSLNVSAVAGAFSIDSECVGAYIGSLYKEKRIDFLIDAAIMIHKKNPEFRLIIAGDGPSRDIVERAVKKHFWIKYVGAVDDCSKAKILLISKVILNPGLVGLGLIDSFVSGVPLVTTDCGLHSPEISYLKNHENGVITKNSLNDFIAAVSDVLESNELHARLSRGCQENATSYTIESMANKFAVGVVECLDSPLYRWRSEDIANS